MRIGYLDCFAGIAGDMFLGALVDAGVPIAVLREATAALNIGASLRVETTDRSGISCIKVHVMEGEVLAETVHTHDGPQHAHEHVGERAPERTMQQAEAAQHTHSVQEKTQHMHKGGHAHTHGESHSHAHGHEEAALPEVHAPEKGHAHGRSLTEIRALIEAAALDAAVKRTAIRAFELLGFSEAKIHNVPVEEIHFHEVGAVDAIADMVAASAGIHHLRIGAWYCSAVNVGGGMVQCAHGNFPVPAPATADLLRGVPTYSAHVQKELVTPTGAALLRALEPVFGPQPAMRVEAIGYGAGTRNPEGFPNVLRLSVGETDDVRVGYTPGGAVPDTTAVPRTNWHAESLERSTGDQALETVTVLETALDDLSPQIIAWVADKALAEGALDVMLTPVVMKKGRPGTLVTVICNSDASERLQQMLLRETSTLGVRVRQESRMCLERSHRTVETEYGSIRMKVGSAGGEIRNAAPEFEDCRAAAAEHGVPLKVVQQAAVAAFVHLR